MNKKETKEVIKNPDISMRPVMVQDIIHQANNIIAKSDYGHKDYLQKVLSGWMETMLKNSFYTYSLYQAALSKNKVLRKKVKELTNKIKEQDGE